MEASAGVDENLSSFHPQFDGSSNVVPTKTSVFLDLLKEPGKPYSPKGDFTKGKTTNQLKQNLVLEASLSAACHLCSSGPYKMMPLV